MTDPKAKPSVRFTAIPCGEQTVTVVLTDQEVAEYLAFAPDSREQHAWIDARLDARWLSYVDEPDYWDVGDEPEFLNMPNPDVPPVHPVHPVHPDQADAFMHATEVGIPPTIRVEVP